VPTPRHASHAAIDPVETVTPPSFAGIPWMTLECHRVRATEPGGSCCISLFYAEFQLRRRRPGLLLLQVDGFVVVAGDAGANLSGRFPELRLLVGVEAFLGAGGALGAVQPLKATAQAGVAL
jgi:hypothetical protein